MFQTEEDDLMIFISEFKDFLLANHLAKITIFSYPFFQECCLLGKSPSHGGLRAFSRDAELEAAASP